MTMAQLGAFMDLHEIGHYRLTANWRNLSGDSISRQQDAEHAWLETSESGLPLYRTKRCGQRACWACQHRARSRLRRRVSEFIDDHVIKQKRKWRFVTLTLPGEWYEIRRASLEKQFERVKKAFRSWRGKMKRMGRLVSGFFTYEMTMNKMSSHWHAHVHLIMPWRKLDYNKLRSMWTESVDRPMRKQLESWTDGKFTNDSRVVKVDPITDEGVGAYLTKVTNYVTKGPTKSQADLWEVGKVLYRKRTNGWLGEYYGTKKKR